MSISEIKKNNFPSSWSNSIQNWQFGVGSGQGDNVAGLENVHYVNNCPLEETIT